MVDYELYRTLHKDLYGHNPTHTPTQAQYNSVISSHRQMMNGYSSQLTEWKNQIEKTFGSITEHELNVIASDPTHPRQAKAMNLMLKVSIAAPPTITHT